MKEVFSIKENRDFRRLYHRGKNAATGYLVLYAAPNQYGHRRLGLTVGLKLGGAVVRNRCKRLLREAYRLHETELPNSWDYVLVARTRLTTATCQEAESALLKAVSTLGLQRKTQKSGE